MSAEPAMPEVPGSDPEDRDRAPGSAPADAASSKFLKRAFLGNLITLGASLLLSLLFLRQWGSDDPWSRVDRFAGTYLVLVVLMRVLQGLGLKRAVLRNEKMAQEVSGLTFNPESGKWMRLLGSGPPLLALDYGQLHLVPALENAVLQTIGLILYIFAELWWYWVDSYLRDHFASGLSSRSLITSGPFRRIRHPRYTGMIIGKSGVALLFASVIGWVFVLGWVVLLLKRMPREEAHMTEIFGSEYQAYMGRTFRLLPGIY